MISATYWNNRITIWYSQFIYKTLYIEVPQEHTKLESNLDFLQSYEKNQGLKTYRKYLKHIGVFT